MYMIPPNYDETTSDGEKQVFRLLKEDNTRPEWRVLHAQDVARHRSQMKGEIDFLIIAPGLGVLVLEVKGWIGFSRRDGVWIDPNAPQRRSKSPFKQASEAMHSVLERVQKRDRSLGNSLFISAACFPNMDFRDQSEEWESWQVLDRALLQQRPIGDCIESVLRQARKRADGLDLDWFWRCKKAGAPTERQRDGLVTMLRPDYEYPEQPRDRQKRIGEKLRQFTEEQFYALDMARWDDRVIFDGPAGTGKTVLAVEEARRAQAVGKAVLLLCFNRALCTSLQRQTIGFATVAGRPVVTVKTIHQFMEGLIGPAEVKKIQGAKEYWTKDLPDAAETQLIKNTFDLERIEASGVVNQAAAARLGIYDHLVVDEAQDLLRDCFIETLDSCIRGGLKEGSWQMFGDFEWQTVFNTQASVEKFRKTRGGGARHVPLTKNCRNTQAVSDWACRVGGVQADCYSEHLRADDGAQPDVRYYVDAQAQQQELVRVLDELKEAGFTGPQVLVLSTHSDNNCCAGALTEQRWRDKLELLVEGAGADGPVNLHTNKTHYCSMRRAKGLEASAVVLTDVDDPNVVRDQDQHMIYVGASRTLDRLVVLAHKSLKPYLQ